MPYFSHIKPPLSKQWSAGKLYPETGEHWRQVKLPEWASDEQIKSTWVSSERKHQRNGYSCRKSGSWPRKGAESSTSQLADYFHMKTWKDQWFSLCNSDFSDIYTYLCMHVQFTGLKFGSTWQVCGFRPLWGEKGEKGGARQSKIQLKKPL